MTAPDPHWPRASEWLARADAEPRLVVVGAPTSAASISPSEAWRTPPALREVLARFSTFDGESGVDLLDLPVADRGDWDIAGLDPTDAVAAIERAAAELSPGPVHVFLGGDNVITYPLVAGLRDAPTERFGVLTFDAHHDVRVTDAGITNGAPIRALLEAGLPGDHVVQVGIHSFANSRTYRRWAQEHGIRVVTMPQVERRGIGAVVAEALDELAGRSDAVHVDLDIDVLDRAFAPGCPGARPGGMTPRQLADAARLAGAHPAVVSADLVEVDVTRDVADLTVMAMATTFLAFAAGVASRPT
ncbi:MAG: agmatinase family protein [Actinobacteria bacterium]|nr:agmatinase family protein [Actinomycetota bacterium]